jgi:hypothetical protein
MGTADEEELYKRQQMDERLRVQEQTRLQQEALAKFREEQERKAAEEAAKKGNMVADPEPVVANWPDDGFQAVPQTGMDKVAGALRVGQAGDVAFARDLLNSGQAPLGGVSKPEGTDAGAQESATGSRGAKPALGLG